MLRIVIKKVPFLILLIITVPACLSLLTNGYFPMHDDQHIVRLYVLDQGIRQGQLYPRWVDGLGFNYGYPLFNFYPPLIYYVAEIFHLAGFSFIWSIKLMLMTGFLLAAGGAYLLIKSQFGRLSALVGATLYTYSFYHAVTVYVRGAFAEFFSMSIFPFVLHALFLLYKKPRLLSILYFGVSFAFLILTHPLIAFPALFFIVGTGLFYFLFHKNRPQFVVSSLTGGLVGLMLSAFFWLPSYVERQYTLVDSILTTELAAFKLHFIFPMQLYYSPWGYGGSGAGIADGMTFQLGKLHMGLAFIAVFFLFVSYIRKISAQQKHILFFMVLLLFSLYMSLPFSLFLWERISYLAYLQFPWRFLTFTTLFLAVVASSALFLFTTIMKIKPVVHIGIAAAIMLGAVVIYGKYFTPSEIIQTTDRERTSFDEVSWRVSSTSYEFAPKETATKKSAFGTTILAIDKPDVPTKRYELLQATAEVVQTTDTFQKKEFAIHATTPVRFQLNTFAFPGWKAYLTDGEGRTPLSVDVDNHLHLIQVTIPPGTFTLTFQFENTPVRVVGDAISITSVGVVALLFLFKKKVIKVYSRWGGLPGFE